jgi:hypothetical protein
MKKLIFLMPVGLFAVAEGFSAVVMLLWNWLMPALFGLGVISFWQALGILVLSRILFGGFGGRHGLKRHKHHAGHIREKWMKMTPEQRKEFIKNRREHFGRGEFFIDEDTPEEQDKP